VSRLVVLMYHRVAPGASGPLAHLTVPPERFAWQMAKLRERGCVPQRQQEVAAWLAGRGTLPPRAVVVTFDDGYADNVTHAFPVLERHRIPAVTFVVTGKLGAMIGPSTRRRGR
jgi:peptidoglycan/xylan/chitin deacetylase (PgdA/CDA1 family)